MSSITINVNSPDEPDKDVMSECTKTSVCADTPKAKGHKSKSLEQTNLTKDFMVLCQPVINFEYNRATEQRQKMSILTASLKTRQNQPGL